MKLKKSLKKTLIKILASLPLILAVVWIILLLTGVPIPIPGIMPSPFGRALIKGLVAFTTIYGIAMAILFFKMR